METEKLTRDEAIQFLTRQRDLAGDAQIIAHFVKILSETGQKVGYAPAFRCLVMGLEPEESIRWGK